MIVIDASALIAVLRHEPEAKAFLRIIDQARACLLSAVSHLETSLVLAGRTRDRTAWNGLDALVREAGMEIVPFDAGQAEAAREAFLRFGKGRQPAVLNFGEALILALAISGWVACGFGEAVEERAWDCCHVLGLRGR